MRFTTAVITLIAAAACLATASPIDQTLEAHQATSSFQTIFKVLTKGQIDGDIPVCDINFRVNETYHMSIGQDTNGRFYEICYKPDNTSVYWDQATADAAKCLTNLHFTPSKCISVKGSSCDNGYIGGGGRLQNLRGSNVISSGKHNGIQISAEESVTYQAAWNGIVGRHVMGSGNKGPYVYVVEDETGAIMTGTIMLQAQFIGENEC